MEGLTILEMSQELGIKEGAVRQRLVYAKIKAFSKKPLYRRADLEIIKAMSKVGRPKKEEAGDGETEI